MPQSNLYSAAFGRLKKIMAKYRKKPVVIEAKIWNGKNTDEIIQWSEGQATYEGMASGDCCLVIETLESNPQAKTRHAASIGDWIIKGVSGEFYPCKPDIFEKTYEKILD